MGSASWSLQSSYLQEVWWDLNLYTYTYEYIYKSWRLVLPLRGRYTSYIIYPCNLQLTISILNFEIAPTVRYAPVKVRDKIENQSINIKWKKKLPSQQHLQWSIECCSDFNFLIKVLIIFVCSMFYKIASIVMGYFLSAF